MDSGEEWKGKRKLKYCKIYCITSFPGEQITTGTGILCHSKKKQTQTKKNNKPQWIKHSTRTPSLPRLPMW